MSDPESGITSTYYYDFIDRLCHYTEKAEGYSLVMNYNFNTIGPGDALPPVPLCGDGGGQPAALQAMDRTAAS